MGRKRPALPLVFPERVIRTRGSSGRACRVDTLLLSFLDNKKVALPVTQIINPPFNFRAAGYWHVALSNRPDQVLDLYAHSLFLVRGVLRLGAGDYRRTLIDGASKRWRAHRLWRNLSYDRVVSNTFCDLGGKSSAVCKIGQYRTVMLTKLSFSEQNSTVAK